MSDQVTISGPSLKMPYRPVAIYLEDADSVEYLREDAPRVYRRIDGFLTLVLDMDDRCTIGFRLIGFRNFYSKHLKPDHGLNEKKFLVLVDALEKAIGTIGDDVFEHNQRRQNAYSQAKQIAREDNVTLEPIAA